MTPEQARARQQEVVGAPMRVPPLPQEELGPEMHELVARIGRSLGYEPPEELTTYFALMARHPAFFRCNLESGIMFFTQSALPPRDRELAVLRTAWLSGAPYEWGEHVAIGRKLGIGPDDTDRIRQGPEAPGWSDHERALLTAVDELVARQMISDATWASLAHAYNEQQLIEVPALVGQYLAVAMIQNSLRVPLARESKGFAER
ncbi:MAG: carboxymuconolactone decarboxylase family protein [Novosphingobium sp.]